MKPVKKNEPRTLRVLTYTSLFPDSARPTLGIFIYQRLRHFAKRPGHSVTVLAPVPYVPAWIRGAKAREYRAVPRKEEMDGMTVYHPRYLHLPRIGMTLHGLFMYLGSRQTLKQLGKNRFDLIDAHYVYPDGLAAMLAARTLNLPLVVSARGTDINEFPNFATIRPMIRATLKSALGTIGVCRQLRDAMVGLGANPHTSVTIGNGIDLSRFWPTPMAEARSALKIAEGYVVVSVGALIPRKRHEATIAAIGALKREGIDASLYIIGEGESRFELQSLINRMGLQDCAFLIGAVPNERLQLWYSAADLTCLASLREGWANVLLESMACGAPVVATRIWGTPDVIVSDYLGKLCGLDHDSLVAALRSGLTQRWDRDRIAKYARSRTWHVVAEELEEFFLALLSRSTEPSALTKAQL